MRKARQLLQGPSKKNQALLDVEYVLHSAIGLAYTLEAAYADRQGLYLSIEGTEAEARLYVNDDQQLMADCPNGRTYNLSLALKYANLQYFMLEGRDSELIARCKQGMLRRYAAPATVEGESKDSEVTVSDRLTSGIGYGEAQAQIYDVEARAITQYTDADYYSVMNKLLRGELVINYLFEPKQIFISSMLALSGVNKNVSAGAARLYRKEAELPAGLDESSKAVDVIAMRRGFFSCSQSTNSHFKPATSFPIHLELQASHQQSIASVAWCKGEQEVLHPPVALKTVSSREVSVSNDEGGIERRRKVVVKMVQGVATEDYDEYIVDLSLQAAHQILKKPYEDKTNPLYRTDDLDPLAKINRHNHALAHHVRVVSYVDSVIDYFKTMAMEPVFREFCDQLTHEDINTIKILLAFSKTGRESEIGFFDAPERYQEFQEASVTHLIAFMRTSASYSDEEIELYADILRYMGNPEYAAMPSALSEADRSKQVFINHIITLAHKLDLPRCYGKSQYKKSLQMYNDTALVDTMNPNQKMLFDNLQIQARNALRMTGDQIYFSDYHDGAVGINEGIFFRSNIELAFCKDVCHAASMQVGTSRYSIEALITAGDVDAVLAQIDQITAREVMDMDVLSLAIRRDADPKIITALLKKPGVLCTRLQVENLGGNEETQHLWVHSLSQDLTGEAYALSVLNKHIASLPVGSLIASKALRYAFQAHNKSILLIQSMLKKLENDIDFDVINDLPLAQKLLALKLIALHAYKLDLKHTSYVEKIACILITNPRFSLRDCLPNLFDPFVLKCVSAMVYYCEYSDSASTKSRVWQKLALIFESGCDKGVCAQEFKIMTQDKISISKTLLLNFFGIGEPTLRYHTARRYFQSEDPDKAIAEVLGDVAEPVASMPARLT